MNAITFIGLYDKYVAELEALTKIECQNAIQAMRQTDPHDLISPDTWFQSEYCARGFVYTLFMNECRKTNNYSIKDVKEESYTDK